MMFISICQNICLHINQCQKFTCQYVTVFTCQCHIIAFIYYGIHDIMLISTCSHASIHTVCTCQYMLVHAHISICDSVCSHHIIFHSVYISVYIYKILYVHTLVLKVCSFFSASLCSHQYVLQCIFTWVFITYLHPLLLPPPPHQTGRSQEVKCAYQH